MIIINEQEKAYIAGIIDGEGSIMLIKFHKNQFPSPCVSIASTTLELLEWIKIKSNMGVIKNKKNYNTNKHKQSYTYITKYNDAINLLKDITPYLVIDSKRKRAEMILNDYKNITPRNGVYSKELLIKKNEFYNKFINL